MHWRIHIMHAPWKPIPCLVSLCCILASLLAGGEGGWKSGLQEWILQSGLAVGRERIMIDRVADRSLADHSFADRFLHPKVEDGLQIGAADAGSEKDEKEETGFLALALNVLAECIMSHVRAQMPDPPPGGRICPERSS
jgi:hypothetical protein